MEQAIMNNLAEFGLAGAVIAVLLYQVIYLQKKLISVIETNTKVMTGLSGKVDNMKQTIDKCKKEYISGV